MTAFSLLPVVVQVLIAALLITFGTFCLISVLRGVFHFRPPVPPPAQPEPATATKYNTKQERLWRQYYALAPVFDRMDYGGKVYVILPRVSFSSQIPIYFRVRHGYIEWSMGSQKNWSDFPIPQPIYREYGE